jgi:hypothetical protein
VRIAEEEKAAFQHSRTGCILDGKLAPRLGFHIGDKLTIVGDAFPVSLEFEIVGIYDDPDQTIVIVTTTRTRRALPARFGIWEKAIFSKSCLVTRWMMHLWSNQFPQQCPVP